MLDHEAREDCIGVALVVYHHRVLHAGKTLDDGCLFVRVWNTWPVAREPVERVPSKLHHMMEVGRRIFVGRLHARSTVSGFVDDDAGGVPHVVVAQIEGHVRNVDGSEPPRVHRRLSGHRLRRHLRARRDVDRLVSAHRLRQPLEIRRLQHVRGVEQCAGAPHDVVGRHRDRDIVVVEVAVELLHVSEVHRIPTVVIVVHGDARIEVSQEPSRGVDHPLPPAPLRDVVVPLEREVHRIVRQQRRGKLERLRRVAALVYLPRRGRAIHCQRIDVNSGRQVILSRAKASRRAGLVDVEEQPDHQIAQGVRAVVGIGDLLAASNGPVGGQSRYRDVVTPAILPVGAAGFSIGRSRSLVVSVLDCARHVQRIRSRLRRWRCGWRRNTSSGENQKGDNAHGGRIGDWFLN